MRNIIVLLIAFFLILPTLAADPRPSNAMPPKSGGSREDILKAIKNIKEYGIVEWTESSRWGRRILVVWYCPFSGRAGAYAHAYYYDDKGWHLFFDKLIDGTHELSVELPADQDILRFRGFDGSIVHTEPLDKIPKVYDR